MTINLRRCFFHSIVPIRKKNALLSLEDRQFIRLKLMLDSGYIYPGNMLKDVFTSEYDFLYKSDSDSVFLAQHSMTELPSYGGSFFNGEFSAYLEHIIGNPSWVFDENIVNGKMICDRAHSLSEEVCVQEPICLCEAIAIMLPYRTPATDIFSFLQYKEFQIFHDDDYDDEMKDLLNDVDERLVLVYDKIKRWKDVLADRGYYIPCINHFGRELDIDKEKEYILENEENVRKLLKK